ncbi:alpha-mannosidase [Halanaerobium saccharolyticum]|uniref:Alpha-mannosidase n=1 Tax=Halanaerobium saccharolyticum TaxID=43595 RepID=A0A4R6LSI3_9FIRM|nr:alpha-mannosidase [Halanaerobium saccharolyticum]TDO91297.1 alpha-mannosidase [Halanaerobium saccharolyticum]
MFFKTGKIERYLKDLKSVLNQKEIAIENFKKYPASIQNKSLPDFTKLAGEDFNVGASWGGKDKSCWFRAGIAVPESWKELQGNIYLEIIPGQGHSGGLSGSESLLYLNGRALQGLDRNHSLVKLSRKEMENNSLEIAVKAFSGPGTEKQQFKKAALVYRDKNVEEFYRLAETLKQTIAAVAAGENLRHKLLNKLNQAFNIIDFRKPGSKEFLQTAAEANQYLKDSLAGLKSESNLPQITAVGHSHIDVAWLWRLLHTREKTARTFSTVLKLMDEYPDYTFVQSSPQLYKFIKEDYPEIYKKIKEKIKAGKWEVTGGMWVEADCNLTSGESLVRQFLHGQRFVKEEFDLDWNILWLPDVFGYSWALPQIIKKSGMEYFMTTKISWSQFNRPEYDTFKWRGIDGTEVLTHFITTPEVNNDEPFYTYNGLLNPESVKGSWDNYQQKDINDQLLLAYGWGDGGGGPTRKMIETGKNMQQIPGLPKIKFGSAEAYFSRLAERVSENKDLPVWDGELYLEYHRGTYTSQAEIKKNNRKAEILLHDTELFRSFAALEAELDYPAQKLSENWEVLLKNQFHDILPGSSIKEVYQDSAAEFKELFNTAAAELDSGLKKIAAQIKGEEKKLVVFNSLPWQRSGYIEFDGREIMIDDLPASGYKAYNIVESSEGLKLEAEIEAQKEADFKKSQINYLTAKSKAQEVGEAGRKNLLKLEPEKNLIENRYYRIKLNEQGQIISIYDRQFRREIIPEGKKANLLQAFEDRPMQYNAWDIDIYYQEKEYPVDQLQKMKIDKQAERIVVNLEWKFLDSTISQQMIVYANQRRIDFKTDVDWQEEQILLKTAFPVDVRSTTATYEIQFGNVERSTHWNTSWDYAKFETVGQKWVDLSERDYGVSLLNDCKYGHDIKDQTMRLSLIKSGIDPDPEADQGQHSFTYSLYPHGGDWFEAGTTKEAYELNYPLKTVIAQSESGEQPQQKSFVDVDSASTILETVKKAEASDDLILRFYEYGSRREKVRVDLGRELKEVSECNLMEKETTKIAAESTSFEFEIKPYEIKTFKVKLQN